MEIAIERNCALLSGARAKENFQKRSPRYLLIRWIMLLLKGNNCVMIFIEFRPNRMLNARLKPLILHPTIFQLHHSPFSKSSRVIIIIA